MSDPPPHPDEPQPDDSQRVSRPIPGSTRTPAEPRSPADFVYALAVAAVVLAGVGLLISAGDNRWVYVVSLILTILGVISGAGGVFLGWSRGYIEPAYAAIACTCFAVLMMLIVIVSMIGVGFSPADVAEAIDQSPDVN